ncbi:capsule biosynthesis GfcC family protein [Photobacterium rosenbergii]|uniref:Capsule biosynthesis GfcC family protein n=1 Tax=Photobacterium rosenbergii TaxID=294936 RepID=A0ABU3ZPZ1_9GAMM|nr:capsule biosynthesis GfcC family protein [Photobacterium rosenbergii]MDV5172144.1 capsule biosynthesis GfcC family protein [Photobacterium rosenbergii]
MSFFRFIQRAMPPLLILLTVASFNPPAIAANNTQNTLSVTIYSPNKAQAWSLNYLEPVRLSQVIGDNIATQLKNASLLTNNSGQSNPFRADSIFWLGSTLSSTSEPENKPTVLKLIDQLVDKEPTSFALKASLRANERWINDNILYTKQFIPLDYDAIRLNKKLNPLLRGEYHLYLANRPNDVLVIGATQKPTAIRWQPRLSAKQYLDNTALIDNHQKDYAVVIQPDGTAEQHPIAYWNRDHRDVAPGATIFIGYGDLPSDYKSLNQEMINLLRNKVL